MISLRLAFVFLTFIYVSAQLPCLKITDCTQCKQTSGCGYCDVPGGVGTCFPSVSETLCTTVGGRWNPNTCSPPIVSDCLTATDCTSCLNRNTNNNVNVNSTSNSTSPTNSTSTTNNSTNTIRCGWCNLGDVGVCHDSNATCNAMSGSFFTDKCPTGTNCGNYSSCQECQQDRNCTSCQITPTTFTCVSAQQKDLFCPAAFYRQGASCNVSAEALACASRATCDQCAGNFTQSNNTQFNNNTQSNNNNVSCAWCNWGSARGGECFNTQDSSFCRNFGLWNEPCPTAGAASTCTNVSNLQFCTNDRVASNKTDMPWVTKLMDSFLNTKWENIGKGVKNQLNGVQWCDACWKAYEKWQCAVAYPSCGMEKCSREALARGSATDCIAACPCDGMTELYVQPTCYHCVQGCYSAAVAQPCGQFGINKKSCLQLVNICGCNPSQDDANTICQDFSDNGYMVDLGNASCATNTPSWCGMTNGNMTNNNSTINNSTNNSSLFTNSTNPPLNNGALQQPQPGRLCPNSQLCLSVYNALGANVIAAPVTTLQGVNNNGGTNNGTGNNNAAVSNCASPLLLLAGMFLLLFV